MRVGVNWWAVMRQASAGNYFVGNMLTACDSAAAIWRTLGIDAQCGQQLFSITATYIFHTIESSWATSHVSFTHFLSFSDINTVILFWLLIVIERMPSISYNLHIGCAKTGWMFLIKVGKVYFLLVNSFIFTVFVGCSLALLM